MAGKKRRPLDQFFNAVANMGTRPNYVSPWGMGPRSYQPPEVLERKLPSRQDFAYEISSSALPPGVESLRRTLYGPSVGAVSDEASQIYANRLREQWDQMTDAELVDHFNQSHPSSEVLKLLPPARLARILNRSYKDDWIRQNP